MVIWGSINAALGMTPCYAEDRCEKFRLALQLLTVALCYSLALGWYFYLSSEEEVALFFGPLMLSYLWLGIGFAFYYTHFPECYFTTEKFGPAVSKWV